MPWRKLKKPKGKFTHISSSGKLWTMGMIKAYLAKKNRGKGLQSNLTGD